MLEPRIRLYWRKTEKSLIAHWDEGASKATSMYLFQVFGEDVLAQLDKRGYDISTLRFQIRKKPPGVLDQLARIEEDA